MNDSSAFKARRDRAQRSVQDPLNQKVTRRCSGESKRSFLQVLLFFAIVTTITSIPFFGLFECLLAFGGM